jgi:hypothetical protein
MNNFEYGFITKCAEYGVDPEALVKFADDIIRGEPLSEEDKYGYNRPIVRVRGIPRKEYMKLPFIERKKRAVEKYRRELASLPENERRAFLDLGNGVSGKYPNLTLDEFDLYKKEYMGEDYRNRVAKLSPDEREAWKSISSIGGSNPDMTLYDFEKDKTNLTNEYRRSKLQKQLDSIPKAPSSTDVQ